MNLKKEFNFVNYKGETYTPKEDERGLFVFTKEDGKVHIENEEFALKFKGKTLFVIEEDVIKVEVFRFADFFKKVIKKFKKNK